MSSAEAEEALAESLTYHLADAIGGEADFSDFAHRLIGELAQWGFEVVPFARPAPLIGVASNLIEKHTGFVLAPEVVRERVYSVLHAHSCDEEPRGHDWREHLPWDEPTDEADAAALADALIAALPVQRQPTTLEEDAKRLAKAAESVGLRMDTQWWHAVATAYRDAVEVERA